MTMNKIAFVYPWATFGGVERVLINRVLAFSRNKKIVVNCIDIIFTHDSGGLAPLNKVMDDYGLSSLCKAKVSDLSALRDGNYDCVFCIDFEAAIDFCDTNRIKYYVECHTTYKHGWDYLTRLPISCCGIIVPSVLFKRKLADFLSINGKNKHKILTIQNFVPWDIVDVPSDELYEYIFSCYSLKPILFFSRLDKHKNPLEALDAFYKFNQERRDEYFMILCGPLGADIDIFSEISYRGLEGRVLILPEISFSKSEKLLFSIHKSRGIFVSCSVGESFGLSAAEAICMGIPVLLSDIDAHKELVGDYSDEFTYNLGDSTDLCLKLASVADSYIQAYEKMLLLRNTFSSDKFMLDWQEIM
ncbi:hypothetical protein HLBENOHH_03154 [Aeromonas dhakensis]|uniref:glycosyltransferase n=1 Tax=Aeromonas dhakensis TaxID=196024 RepID=UPI00366D97A7